MFAVKVPAVLAKPLAAPVAFLQTFLQAFRACSGTLPSLPEGRKRGRGGEGEEQGASCERRGWRGRRAKEDLVVRPKRVFVSKFPRWPCLCVEKPQQASPTRPERKEEHARGEKNTPNKQPRSCLKHTTLEASVSRWVLVILVLVGDCCFAGKSRHGGPLVRHVCHGRCVTTQSCCTVTSGPALDGWNSPKYPRPQLCGSSWPRQSLAKCGGYRTITFLPHEVEQLSRH